ncbi:membrane protein [Bacteroidales bacterium]|nr:membrane protein [Bacteroidales bacterium]
MIMKTIIKIILFTVVIVLYSATSCVNLDTTPKDKVTDIEFWKNKNAVFNMINSCYSLISSASEIEYADAMSDNAYVKVSNDFNQALANGTASTADKYAHKIWNSRYTGIRYSNLVLDNIHLATYLNEEMARRYTAEAKTMRAYQYFELVSKFGDVPFFKHAVSIEESQKVKRTNRNTIISEILQDLQDIIDNKSLPESYSANDIGRITHWTAMALKARIDLFEGHYREVKDLTSSIMSKSKHRLFPSYSGLFTIANENNEEVLWDIQYKPNSREHSIQSQFLPPSRLGYAQLVPLQSLVSNYITLDGYAIEDAPAGSYDPNNMFDNRDPRLAATIAYTGNSYKLKDGTDHVINIDKGANPDGFGFASSCSPSGYYIKKYWDNTYSTNLRSGLNYIIIRYADVLLMHAEALVELNEMNDEGWNTTIKPIRQRAGFTESSAIEYPGNTNIKEIVRKERRSELAMEGLRTKDIIRWRIAENVLNGWALGFYTGDIIGTQNGFVEVEKRKFDKNKNYLWPIPQSERDLNSNLSQNPNW